MDEVENVMLNLNFYNNKRVLITGNTGFKGSWLTKILSMNGAKVTGYSNGYPTNPSLYKILNIPNVDTIFGDVRDLDKLREVFDKVQPEIVFHLAAQPIVRESYKDPVGTYSTNVMGTVNICECVRNCDSVKSFLNITTDKVYENKEWAWGYRENEPLDGYDPYSNSKSCSELVTHSYIQSFYSDLDVSVSTARAGNVIGGGDFSVDRIVPDCMRAVENAEKVVIRNPHSTRPYQHVLEPLYAYLLIAEKQYNDRTKASNYNVGPDECDCIETGELVKLAAKYWNGKLKWEIQNDDGPHEANFLKLDCSKMKSTFQWQPRWNVSKAIEKTVEWYDEYLSGNDMNEITERQIKDFFGDSINE